MWAHQRQSHKQLHKAECNFADADTSAGVEHSVDLQVDSQQVAAEAKD